VTPARQPRLPGFEDYAPDIERLLRRNAAERAQIYEAANLGLAERSIIEAKVRQRIAADFRSRK
jgi:hypothetical protein